MVLLEQMALDYGAERRRLRVVKMRGIQFRGGFHDFTIEAAAWRSFRGWSPPSTTKPSPRASRRAAMPSLTRCWAVGWSAAPARCSSGAAGVGKSSLALTYAIAAAERGEHAVLFAFDEGRGTLHGPRQGARAAAAGPCWMPACIRIQQIDPGRAVAGRVRRHVRDSVEVDAPRIVIIDSLNGYLNAMPDERFLVLQMHELLSYLDQHGVLTILVLAQHGLVGPMQTPLDISYLSDAVLMLRYFEFGGTVRRALSVVKKRSGNHEHAIREFRLTHAASAVGPPLTDFSGIFSGMPRYTGDQLPAAWSMMQPRPTEHRRPACPDPRPDRARWPGHGGTARPGGPDGHGLRRSRGDWRPSWKPGAGAVFVAEEALFGRRSEPHWTGSSSSRPGRTCPSWF